MRARRGGDKFQATVTDVDPCAPFPLRTAFHYAAHVEPSLAHPSLHALNGLGRCVLSTTRTRKPALSLTALHLCASCKQVLHQRRGLGERFLITESQLHRSVRTPRPRSAHTGHKSPCWPAQQRAARLRL
eukprot:6191779-Pleurochrysis_carterae.AAC.2